MTGNLRDSMPALNAALDKLPATLHRVPKLSGNVQDAAPVLAVEMRDIKPVLSYIRPYGLDAAPAFSNFSAAFVRDENGPPYLRLQTVFNEASMKETPFKTPMLPVKYNPYPKAHGGRDLRRFSGKALRVERLPRQGADPTKSQASRAVVLALTM